MLAWYRRGARDLPWRRTRDPWAIWVSEVMLQQTRVETATPFYLRFLRRFPNPAALARAGEDAVLAAWSGLGYYRRARHLHEAARTVVREHGGRVPRDPDAFGALPGVGRYTKGAVLSMGFGTALPVLDGNVARVLARLFAVRAAVRDPRGARRLWRIAGALLPGQSPGDWNQALMELGATICTPRAPRCADCPARHMCRAYALRAVARYPASAPRRKTERVRRAVALIARGDRVLMTQRQGALLAGLWEPPGIELADGENARAKLEAELRRLGVKAPIERTERIVTHVITHRAIRVEVWQGRADAAAASDRPGAVATPARARFIKPGDARVGMTALARRLLAR